MLLDSVVLLAAAVFALLGFISGFWRQVLRLAALVAAWLLSVPLGALLAPWLSRRLEIPPLVARLGGTLLAFLLVYLVLAAVGALLVRKWKKKAAQEGRLAGPLLDRLAGAALGGAKVLFLAYLALCLVVLMDLPRGRGKETSATLLKDSRLAAVARKHNLFAGLHLPLVGKLPAMLRVLHDTQAMERLARSPQVRQLVEHPKMRALAADRKLLQEAQADDLPALLANPRLGEVLSDPEIRRLLEQIDWESAARGK